jgi:hypothetical protein
MSFHYMKDSSLSFRDYHIIIASDGTYSSLRQKFGGYDDVSFFWNPVAVARGGFGSIHQQQKQPPPPPSSHNNNNNNNCNGMDTSIYEQNRQNEINIQDRHYTVFRGNASISVEQMKQYDSYNNSSEDILSFQTWGEHSNMRFATVPMKIKNNSNTNDGSQQENQQHQQVWFITIDDDHLIQEQDPMKRRDMLLHKFQSWHDPIKQIIVATPPDEILMERAVAHKRNASPITSFYHAVQQHKQQSHVLSSDDSSINRNYNSNHGPCLLFHGDAYMTLDPILAQGLTCAMEGSYSIRESLEKALQLSSSSSDPDQNKDHSSQPLLTRKNDTSSNDDDNDSNCMKNIEISQLAQRMDYIRYEFKVRHQERIDRLKCVIQISELVQLLGQQQLSNAQYTSFGWYNTNIIRPILQIMPNWIKRPIFNEVMKYSLGMGFFHRPIQKRIPSNNAKRKP